MLNLCHGLDGGRGAVGPVAALATVLEVLVAAVLGGDQLGAEPQVLVQGQQGHTLQPNHHNLGRDKTRSSNVMAFWGIPI